MKNSPLPLHGAPLSLVYAGGRVDIPASALVVGIDDTGNERFSAHHTCFGLGGCAFLASDYGHLIDDPWTKLKAQHFGHVSGPMHAAALRDLTDLQMQALGSFFESNHFFRFAIMAANSSEIEAELPVVTTVGALLMERLLDIATVARPSEVFIVVENSTRLNRQVLDALGGHVMSDGTRQMSVHVCFLPKSAGTSFLEVADFVMHPAGGQLRRRLSGDYSPTRRDFQSVFWRVPSHLVHHNELIRARRIDGGDPAPHRRD